MVSIEQLRGAQKAAVFLISLGPEISGEILRHLKEEEIEQLSLEIASLRKVHPEVRDQIFDEFVDMLAAQEYMTQGGMEYAQSLLEQGLGPEKARMILNRLTATLQVRPFDFARNTDPAQLLSFLQNEHPQTIALIMAYLQPEQAGMILSALSPELQIEVAKRLSRLDQTAPEVIEDVESILEQKLSAFVTHDTAHAGGLEVAVEILNRVDRATERTIMAALEEDDPELAEEIRKRMFVFEDIITLTDRDVRLVIQQVDSKDWQYALKTASDSVKSKLFRNMSKRQVEAILEDMEFLGPVRLKDVEDAQQRVVAVIRRLEEAGEIVIARSGEDELVV
ncbi:MAG: flagellar motor switch protein FliG [Firmicutes bacterium]|nr:flagellar motor switch protein FliG [Bacillota bacterium]